MRVQFAYDGPVVVAVLVPDEGSILDHALGDETFVGVAACKPGDLYVQGIGERIATGRAMSAMGDALEELGEQQSVTIVEALIAEAEETGKNVCIHADLPVGEFAKVGDALQALKTQVDVDFIEHGDVSELAR